MKILDRYILREFFLTLVYCVVAFAMLDVLTDLFDKFARIVEARQPFLRILLYYASRLTLHLEFMMPAALLLTTLYTLWSLTRNGELTAMRASGVSIYRIMLPLLCVGIVLTFFTAAIKEAVAPKALSWAEAYRANDFHEVTEQRRQNVAYLNTTAHRQWLIGSVDLQRPTTLHAVEITAERADSHVPATKLIVESAEWLDGEWWFFNVKSQDYTEAGNPIGAPAMLPDSARGMAMPAFDEQPVDFVNEVKDWDLLSALEMRRYLKSHPDLPPDAKAQRAVDMHLRMAFPWACLIVILFGIPSGARNGRQSMLTGILLTIACFFAFYFLTQCGVFLGKRQVLAPWLGAWMSNMVFLSAGVHMLIRIR